MHRRRIHRIKDQCQHGEGIITLQPAPPDRLEAHKEAGEENNRPDAVKRPRLNEELDRPVSNLRTFFTGEKKEHV